MDEVVTIEPTVDETPTVDLTTEAPARRGRWWLPILVLVLAAGAVVGAAVVAGAAQDERSSAERAEQRADDRLPELEAQADRVSRLDVEEMALNRSSVEYVILESFDQYNGLIDELIVQRNDQYQAALELYQVLNRLRATEI